MSAWGDSTRSPVASSLEPRLTQLPARMPFRSPDACRDDVDHPPEEFRLLLLVQESPPAVETDCLAPTTYEDE